MKNTLSSISFFVAICIIAYIFYSNYRAHVLWTDNDVEKRITVGQITSFNTNNSNKHRVTYQFTVNDEVFVSYHTIREYLTTQSRDSVKACVGKKFQVLFILKDPGYSELLIGEPVAKGTPAPPGNGWSVEYVRLGFKDWEPIR